jgi:hypothetical protein
MGTRKVVLLLVVAGGLFAAWIGLRPAESQIFGDSIDSSSSLTISQAVKDTTTYLGQRIVVEGRIGSVCQSAGCWSVLESGPDRLYVSHLTFAVPPSVAGRSCRAAGRLVMRDERLTLLATGMAVH